MATVKQYGYYIKGNKVSIVEKDTQFDNDVTSKDYGPGADRAQWKSPLTDVSDGLEIEYAYSPSYTLSSSNINTYYFAGYGSNGTNLVLFADEDMSSIHTADDYILINGGPYAGIHQVKTTPASASRVLVTKTVFEPTPSMISITADIYSNETIAGDTSADDAKIENFKAQLPSGTNYIAIDAAVDAANNRLFSLETSDTNELKVNKEYDFNDTTLVWDESNANLSGETNDAVEIYHAYKKPFSVRKVDYIDNEESEIDLSIYLSKALVYYVKAKLSEDAMNIEAKEYFMNEFREMVEKYNNTRVAGLRVQSVGFHAIR
jgi:hypothetical protein